MGTSQAKAGLSPRVLLVFSHASKGAYTTSYVPPSHLDVCGGGRGESSVNPQSSVNSEKLNYDTESYHW